MEIHLLLVYGTPLNSSKLISTFPFACLNPFDFFPYLLSRDLRVKYQEGLLSEKEAEAEWLSRLSRMAFDILMKYDCGHDPGGLLYVFTRQGSIENARLLLQSPHLADNLKDFIKKYMRGTFSEK